MAVVQSKTQSMVPRVGIVGGMSQTYRIAIAMLRQTCATGRVVTRESDMEMPL